jgi:hypothetical protein
MKFKVLFSVFTFLCFFQNANAQLTGAGIQPKMNFSRQYNVVRDMPMQHAITAQGRMSSPGIDVFADFNIGEKWTFRAKAGVETKGFVSDDYFYDVTNRVQKFHYVSTDLNVIRKWGEKTKVQPYNYLGLSTGYLFKRTGEVASPLESTWLDENNQLTFEDYSKFNLGFNAGFGLSFNDVLWLELDYNRDILAPLKQGNLKVYNTVYSVNVGINLLKLLKK